MAYEVRVAAATPSAEESRANAQIQFESIFWQATAQQDVGAARKHQPREKASSSRVKKAFSRDSQEGKMCCRN